MNYLSVEQLSKSFQDTPLFEELTFGISQGQKIALVGRNGCGKSTLLKIISGFEAPDAGNVVVRKDVNLAFLPQEPELDENLTIKEAVFNEDSEMLSAIIDYEEAVARNVSADKLQELMDRLDALNAWDFEYQVHEILGKLGIEHLDQKIGNLSGGQRKRIALAKALLDNPDFLILDEPTNHLDIDVIEWLEKYLSTSTLTILLITHDRYFLENVCDQIFEIDNGTLYSYDGNFSYFLEKKAEREQQQLAEIEKAKNLMRKELDWIRRQPKARGTKAKYRVDAFYDLKDKASQKVDKSEVTVKLNAARQGGKILEIYDLHKAFGELKIVEDFSYTFKRGDKIGVLGKNGVGKSTFLNLLTGQEKAYDGEIVKGETTKLGYFRQDQFDFSDDMRVIDVIKEVAEVIRLADGSEVSASQILQHFLFSPKMHYQHISYLSGGEKKRLQLLRTLVKKPNFLILDEPTNDLDIYTLAVLEDYLMTFPGCLMVVSHDRYFMDRLVEHCFVFKGKGEIIDFPGNYTQYRDFAEEEEKEAKQERKEKQEEKPKKEKAKEKTKLSYKEKQEYESLEKEIEELENRKAELLSLMNQEADHVKITELSEEFQNVEKLIDQKTERWMELSEFA